MPSTKTYKHQNNSFLFYLIKILIFIAFIYLIIMPWMLLKYTYYPSNLQLSISDPTLKSSIKEVNYFTPDKVKLNAWYIKAKKNNPTVIFCHGDGGNITDFQEIAKFLKNKGIGLFIFDYRSFGKSSGIPTEKADYSDLKTSIDYLKTNEHIPENNMVLWGYSFGGAVVAEIAIHSKFKGVILHSTFTSLKDMRIFDIENALNIKRPSFADSTLNCAIRWFPFGEKFDTASKVKNINSPLFITHDKPDAIVPVRMSYALIKNNSKAQFFISNVGSHNDFSWVLSKAYDFIMQKTQNN